MIAPYEFHVTVRSWKKTWVRSNYRAVYQALERHPNWYKTNSDGVLLDFADKKAILNPHLDLPWHILSKQMMENGAQARESILAILSTHLDLPWHTIDIDYGSYYPDFKAVFKPTRLLAVLLPHVLKTALANLIASFVLDPIANQVVDQPNSNGQVNHTDASASEGASHIQQIVHIEPAAEIPPAEADEITTLQHAGFIEHNLGVGTIPEPNERVLLLQLNRTSSDLVEALTHGPALNQCRAEMQAEHCKEKMTSGAFTFVKPWQYHSAIHAAETTLGLCGLKSSHIIFGESVEYLLAEAIDSVRGHGRNTSNS